MEVLNCNEHQNTVRWSVVGIWPFIWRRDDLAALVLIHLYDHNHLRPFVLSNYNWCSTSFLAQVLLVMALILSIKRSEQVVISHLYPNILGDLISTASHGRSDQTRLRANTIWSNLAPGSSYLLAILPKHLHPCIFKQSSIINQRPPYSPPSWEAHACPPDLDLRKMQPLAAPGPPTTTFATSSTIDKPSSFYFYFYQYFYLYCHYWQPLLGRSCPETFLHQIPVAALFYQLMTICFFSLLGHKSWNELIV